MNCSVCAFHFIALEYSGDNLMRLIYMAGNHYRIRLTLLSDYVRVWRKFLPLYYLIKENNSKI